MGKEKLTRWRDQLLEALELPREVLLNLPRLTLVGNRQCCVENHQGVIAYNEESVRIATKSGELIVYGADLSISYLLPEEITVTGLIAGVRYPPES